MRSHPLLPLLLTGVSDGYEERHQAQSVTQIRDYMKKLQKLQQEHKSLSTHVALAERIQRVTKEASFHRRLECEQEALSNATCSAESEALIEDMAAMGEPVSTWFPLIEMPFTLTKCHQRWLLHLVTLSPCVL